MFLFACGRVAQKSEREEPAALHVIEQFTITETESGKLKMTMQGERAEVDEGSGIATIKKPVIKFYRNGNYQAMITMEQADINLDSYDVKGIGKCVVDAVDGEHLETTDLRYNSSENKVYGDEGVKITRPGETLYGTSFEADTAFKNVIIYNQRIVVNNVNI
jgi:LPS export ABC transporter protein LptC